MMQQTSSNGSTDTSSSYKMLTNQVEARKAVLIAEMMEEYMKEEKEITSQFDNDPSIKTKITRS